LGRAKQFILTTAVLSFTRPQKMDDHTVGHYTTSVSMCPTLRGVKHFRSTSHFFMLGVVAIRYPERHMRKASHRGSKQQ